MPVMEEQASSARRSRRSFTSEFKRDAVAMVLDDERSIADVAKALGIGETNLGNWVRQERVDRGERAGLTTSERAELVELRRENARLRMERDLLISQNGAGVKWSVLRFRDGVRRLWARAAGPAWPMAPTGSVGLGLGGLLRSCLPG